MRADLSYAVENIIFSAERKTSRISENMFVPLLRFIFYYTEGGMVLRPTFLVIPIWRDLGFLGSCERHRKRNRLT